MVDGISSRGNATVPAKVLKQGQFPEPMPPGTGSTDVFANKNIIAQNSAVIEPDVLILNQFPEPMQSGVGSTDVFVLKNTMARNSATIQRDVLILKQYPAPLESGIGKEDLPGGFRWSAVISGQENPLQDIARGIIQIDGVKVLFDMRR